MVVEGTEPNLSFSTKRWWVNFGFLYELPATAFEETLTKEAFGGLADISTKRQRKRSVKIKRKE